MHTTVEIKGFKPGEALKKFVYDQLESLASEGKHLRSALLKLSFTDNYFHCNLIVDVRGHPVSISLCDKDSYEVVFSTIDFAGVVLKNALVPVVRRRSSVRRYGLPKRMVFQFSAN